MTREEQGKINVVAIFVFAAKIRAAMCSSADQALIGRETVFSHLKVDEHKLQLFQGKLWLHLEEDVTIHARDL